MYLRKILGNGCLIGIMVELVSEVLHMIKLFVKVPSPYPRHLFVRSKYRILSKNLSQTVAVKICHLGVVRI